MKTAGGFDSDCGPFHSGKTAKRRTVMTQSVKNAILPSVRISKAWPAFSLRLAAVLEKLEEDQFLILSVKNSNRFIQFAAQGSFGVRVETTSNSYLAKPEKLKKEQIVALISLGWAEPTGSPDEATQSNDPDGSPNFFIEFCTPVSFEAVADFAVKTLSKVLRVPHPGSLQYQAFDDLGEGIALPELGLKLEKQIQHKIDFAKLSDLLLEELREFTGINDLAYDQDGDVGIRYGSILIFLQLINDCQYVRIFSPILHEVEDDSGIYTRLNDINANQVQVRYFYKNGTIYAITDVLVVPFVSEFVLQALSHFSLTVDGLGGLLQDEFGGHAAFLEGFPSATKH